MAEPRGRPLRALGLVLGGWVAMRVAMLWPDALPPGLAARAGLPVPARPVVARGEPVMPATVPSPEARRVAAHFPAAPALPAAPPTQPPVAPGPSTGAPAAEKPAPPSHVLALLGLVRFGVPEPPPPGASRWSGSAWGIVRGRGAAGVATPQLGGSQMGARIAYALDEAGRVTLAARAAAALGTRQQEGAIGVEWRPTRLPLRLVAEQRIGIAGVRGGAALAVVGGVADVRLPAGLSLDAYGQAGAIARDGGEGYADGAIRAGRVVARAGGAALDLGLGAWGAAQRGAARLDIGPSAALVLPLGGRRVRVALDWRQRIAGDARPGSGPALSVGADF